LGAAIALPVAYYEYYVVSDFEMNVLKKLKWMRYQ
jgi:hypothetical protein